MSGRDMVRLTEDERRRLEEMVRKGKSPAKRLLKARILLKADVSELGEGWSDGEIIAVFGYECCDGLSASQAIGSNQFVSQTIRLA